MAKQRRGARAVVRSRIRRGGNGTVSLSPASPPEAGKSLWDNKEEILFSEVVNEKRRGARVVEWDGLENRCGGNSTQGSNPCLSAS